jgi:hypothetical protein
MKFIYDKEPNLSPGALTLLKVIVGAISRCSGGTDEFRVRWCPTLLSQRCAFRLEFIGS